MPPGSKLSNIAYLGQINPGAGEAFAALRRAVLGVGPLDEQACELITLGAFATTGEEASFKLHARRLLALKADPAALRQAVLVTFAATTTFSQVIAALRWIDDLVEDAG